MLKILSKNWPIILILLLASFLRLYRLSDYMEFLGDQGRDVVVVARFLTQGDLIFIGPQTSIGNMYLTPWYYYLIALPLLLSNFNPVGPAIFVALIGVATVYLIYLFTANLFNRPSAVLASALYAISPVVIKYSSFSWNPNIMPFFALLFVYSIYLVFFRQQPKYLLISSLSFILCLSSHYLALLLLPLLICSSVIYIYRYPLLRRSFINYFLASLFLFLLSLVPLVLFDLKHHGQNISAIIQFFTVRQTTVNLKAYKAIPEFWPLLVQFISRLFVGKNAFWGQILTPFLSLSWFAALAVFYQKKSAIFYSYLLVILWLFFGILGLGLYKQHLYDHYFGFIFPSIFILSAVAFFQVIKLTKLLFIPIFAVLCLTIYLSIIANPFFDSPNHQLATTIAIDEIITKHSNQKPFNLALLAKQNYDPPYRYFLERNQQPLYSISDRKTDQLFVICEPSSESCQPLGNPFYDIAAFGIAKIDNQWQIEAIKIFKLVPGLL